MGGVSRAVGGRGAACPRDAARPQANPTSCEVGCQSAGWRDKKTCPRRRATTACGRAGPPNADSRRAGGAWGASSRVPRDSPASRRSRRPEPASRRSLHRTPFRGYARRGSFACATPHLSVDRRTPSPGVLDPRFAPKSAARSTGTFEVDVRSKRAATLPSRAVNAPRHARCRRALDSHKRRARKKTSRRGDIGVETAVMTDCSGVARQSVMTHSLR